MKKFLTVIIILIVLGAAGWYFLDEDRKVEIQTVAVAVWDKAKTIGKQTVDDIASGIPALSNFVSGSESGVSLSEVAALSDRIEEIARYFPTGTYFTVDGQPCSHTDGGNSCPNGSCEYESVLEALQQESWWTDLAGEEEWDLTSPYAVGSESFARMLYHLVHGTELDLAPWPQQSFTVNENAYSSLTSLQYGDILCIKSENTEHWAMFLSQSGLNIYLYECNRDGCSGITYNEKMSIEDLFTEYYGCNVDVFR